MNQLLLQLTDDADQFARQLAHFKQHLPSTLPTTLVKWLAYLATYAKREEISDQTISEIQVSEAKAMRIAGIGKSGLRSAIGRLESIKIMAVDRTMRPSRYRINWDRCRKWIESLSGPDVDELVGEWSAPVRDGPAWSGPGCTRERDNYKPRVGVNRDTVFTDTPARTKTDQRRTVIDGNNLRPLPPKPWAASNGICDSQLVAAVVLRDVVFLRHCYDQLIAAGWHEDSERNRQAFLTLCHHCARHKSLRRRVGTLSAKIRANFDCSMTTATSDNWSSVMLWPFDDPSDEHRLEKTNQRISEMQKQRAAG